MPYLCKKLECYENQICVDKNTVYVVKLKLILR